MGHFLAAMATNIGNGAVTLTIDAELTRNLTCLLEKPPDDISRSISGEIVKRQILTFRDHQHMDRSLRIYVTESQHLIVFKYRIVRYLSA